VKVIFIEDVPSVARVGQTRVVADGYARNYLFPRKLAVLADSQAATALETQIKKKIKQREIEEASLAELAGKIDGFEITLRAKVGENEKLYGSVTGADIVAALNQAAGCEIDKKKVDLAEPIKQAGTCDVTINFTHDITAVIKVHVISEDAVEGVAEKAPEAVAEAAPAAVDVEAPAAAVTAAKPPKEKKARAPKAPKEEKPAAEAASSEEPKKEKKTRARVKKAEAPAEENKES
jgi:large subunit ribosomal protein L9